MSTSRIIFIRHGQYHQLPNTPSAHQPFALNKEGFEQAEECVHTLRKLQKEFGLVFHPRIECSEQLRAWQTAETIRARLDEISDIKCYDDLSERSLGVMANLNLQQIEQAMADDPRYPVPPEGWKASPHFRLPYRGAESLMDAGERVATFIQNLAEGMAAKPETITKVLVGHGASFRHAAYFLGLLKFDQISKLSMYHANPMLFEVDSEGTWRHIAGEWKDRTPQDEAYD